MPTYQNTTNTDITEKGIKILAGATLAVYKVLSSAGLNQTSAQPYHEISNGGRESISVASGATSSPVYIRDTADRCTLAVKPGAGGSMTAQITISPRSAVEAGTANWMNWKAGSLAAAGWETIGSSVTAVRASAVAQPGTFEIAVHRFVEG